MALGDMMTHGMRRALTDLGARELRTPAEVDEFMEQAKHGTALLAINSACGCAGGGMRPGVALALRQAAAPEHFATVFAGQDADATARAREYLADYPPSSPAVVILRDGEVGFMMPRERIQGRQPDAIAAELAQALEALS